MRGSTNVCLGDGRTVEALGRGNIHFRMVFKMSKPKEVTMYNALYVPKLTCNLFSVRAAATKGNSVQFGNSKCWIRDRNGKLLGIGSLVQKLYYLDCKTITWEHVTVASGSRIGNKADLWHQRLNEHQLKEMVNQDLVKGVEIRKSTGISFCVWKARCSEDLLSQWENSVQQGNYSVCIVMYVDLCLWTLLEERDTLLLLSMTTQDIVRYTL